MQVYAFAMIPSRCRYLSGARHQIKTADTSTLADYWAAHAASRLNVDRHGERQAAVTRLIFWRPSVANSRTISQSLKFFS